MIPLKNYSELLVRMTRILPEGAGELNRDARRRATFCVKCPETVNPGLQMPVATPLASLSDPATFANGVPHGEFARRRRDAPIAWVDEVPLVRHSTDGATQLRGTGYWALTRYNAIETVSRRPEVFSSAIRGAFLTDPVSHQDLERNRQILINMDAPEHAELRKFVTTAFTARTVERLKGSILEHAQTIVERTLRNEAFDVVRDMAAELPLLVLTDLLGMPREDRHLMFEWSNNLVGFDDTAFGGGSVHRYKQTFVEAFGYARELAAVRRKRPADDLVSALVRCERNGRKLTDEEFCHVWILLVVGGNESTRHFLSGSLQALIEWPAERERLVRSSSLIPTAVEELLRWVSPIMVFRRTVANDVEVDGRLMLEGDKVALYYISANRDEEIFDTPNQLDLARSPNLHLAFGIGPHFCLGARLARVEAAALLQVLRPHLSRLELTGPVVRLASNFMNGIKSMPARFASTQYC